MKDLATLGVADMIINQLRQKIGVTFGSWPVTGPSSSPPVHGPRPDRHEHRSASSKARRKECGPPRSISAASMMVRSSRTAFARRCAASHAPTWSPDLKSAPLSLSACGYTPERAYPKGTLVRTCTPCDRRKPTPHPFRKGTPWRRGSKFSGPEHFREKGINVAAGGGGSQNQRFHRYPGTRPLSRSVQRATCALLAQRRVVPCSGASRVGYAARSEDSAASPLTHPALARDGYYASKAQDAGRLCRGPGSPLIPLKMVPSRTGGDT